MTKHEIVDVFNSQLKGDPVNIERLIELVSIYLEDKYPERRDIYKLALFVAEQKDLLYILYPKLVVYFAKKYNINHITFNNKILSYYD